VHDDASQDAPQPKQERAKRGKKFKAFKPRPSSIFSTLVERPLPLATPEAKITVDTPLTRRELKLLELLVREDGRMTHTQCAIAAGYPTNTARQTLDALLDPIRHPNFVAALRTARDEEIALHQVTRARHMRDLKDLRDRAISDKKWQAAITAEVQRGKAAEEPLYVSRSEVRTGSLESMSKEEIRKELERLKGEYLAMRGGAIEGEVVRDAPRTAAEAAEDEIMRTAAKTLLEHQSSPVGDSERPDSGESEENSWLD